MTAADLLSRPAAGITSARAHVVQGACALAAGMGVGRFVYTPILPLMTAQAGLTASAGADLATANYVGNLAGALLGMFAPRWGRSRAVHRGALVLLTASLAAMPATHSVAAWFVLRLLAGAASGVVFVFAAGTLLGHLRGRSAHLPGWGFSGVGAGIALSGALVLVLEAAGDWRTAWWSASGLCAVLTAAAWPLRPEPDPEPAAGERGAARPRTHRWFSVLFASYTLEGVGYIIAGTFLVAAIVQNSSRTVGGAAWVVVGIAAVPSSVLWARLGRRRTRPDLLLAALLVQAVGIALPALVGGVAAAFVAAFLFGATFLGVSSIALAAGTHLRFPRAVALLTAGYSAGQILGPQVATPLLHHGYHLALLMGASIVAAAAASAALLRVGFPHRMPAADEHQAAADA
ncbi:Predicted arabinose efflux permease, MFS family [Actinacidiphila guanduensis]|uniref:Predicted arabinose efflux permease, MFS family n=2 Tax=Actinacidiphila guanduensis TaxID=310781 RepID=A0A1H0MUF7_9ACTN|nr:YbfB/YjiJ family MFS transporter [Actinacidiphila guanduensis]SDO84011.1 Predicted arabinose efflux permease, MFS family [Actinacidiphila guanduensis]